MYVCIDVQVYKYFLHYLKDDDIYVIYRDEKEYKQLIIEISKVFPLKRDSSVDCFLGFEIKLEESGQIVLSQNKLLEKTIKKMELDTAKEIKYC